MSEKSCETQTDRETDRNCKRHKRLLAVASTACGAFDHEALLLFLLFMLFMLFITCITIVPIGRIASGWVVTFGVRSRGAAQLDVVVQGPMRTTCTKKKEELEQKVVAAVVALTSYLTPAPRQGRRYRGRAW